MRVQQRAEALTQTLSLAGSYRSVSRPCVTEPAAESGDMLFLCQKVWLWTICLGLAGDRAAGSQVWAVTHTNFREVSQSKSLKLKWIHSYTVLLFCKHSILVWVLTVPYTQITQWHKITVSKNNFPVVECNKQHLHSTTVLLPFYTTLYFHSE